MAPEWGGAGRLAVAHPPSRYCWAGATRAHRRARTAGGSAGSSQSGRKIFSSSLELQFPHRSKAFLQAPKSLLRLLWQPILRRFCLLAPPHFRSYHKDITIRMSFLKHRWDRAAQNFPWFPVANKGNSKLLSMVFNAFHSLALVYFSRAISSFSYQAQHPLQPRPSEAHQSSAAQGWKGCFQNPGPPLACFTPTSCKSTLSSDFLREMYSVKTFHTSSVWKCLFFCLQNSQWFLLDIDF